MTPSLKARIMKAAEFDIVAASTQARIECKTMLRDMISRGDAQFKARNLAEWQHAQLKPLLEALACVAETLNGYADKHRYRERIEAPLRKGGCPIVIDDLGPCPSGGAARDALSKLESVLALAEGETK